MDEASPKNPKFVSIQIKDVLCLPAYFLNGKSLKVLFIRTKLISSGSVFNSTRYVLKFLALTVNHFHVKEELLLTI